MAVNSRDLVEWLDGCQIRGVSTPDGVSSYLRATQETLFTELENGDIVGLGDVFYTTLLSQLTGTDLRPSFRDAVSSVVGDLATDEGGYQELTSEMVATVNGWDGQEVRPTALGTAYCVFLNELLGRGYDNSPSNIAGWLTDLQEDGLFINPSWSNTNLRHRYPTEYIREASLALTTLEILSQRSAVPKIPYQETVRFIRNRPLWGSDFLSAEYYSVRVLEQAGEDLDDKARMQEFLDKHQSEVDVGYQEYLLEEKSDKQSGSSSRTGRDSVTPMVYASMQALLMKKRYGLESKSQLRRENTELLDHAKSESGGYGFEVNIREYEPTYGPETTPRETYYAVLGKNSI